jgi:uridine kinase
MTIQTDELQKLNHWRRYQSTLSFILYVAAAQCYPKRRLRIEHSMSKGYYCLLGTKITPRMLRIIEQQMKNIIRQDVPIRRKTYKRAVALEKFKQLGRNDKVALLKNIRMPTIIVYQLHDLLDTFLMPPFDSTGQVDQFSLRMFSPGFVMVFPLWQDISKMPSYVRQSRLARIFNEYEEWATILKISDLGQLNQAIKDGRGPEIIKVSEALHEKKLVYIADRIVKERKKLVLIAGPSSAGKTTFTKRLSIQLLVNGIRPLLISADDYFFPHSKTPRDKEGRLDFESIHAVDIPLLNTHLRALLSEQSVHIPRFNFVTGRRNKGRKVTLPSENVIFLEGIHCLNHELTHAINQRLKFSVYVSALTQLNIDDHNRVSTTDIRMIRRIIRDTHYRGYRIREVLRHWGKVRNGEEKNIYPFQEEADEMFNSALIYEPAVMKKYCVPIVRQVKKTQPEYEEARRLHAFLTLFNSLEEKDIPSNSIVREFIGGSSFVY